ncbi:MAG TPA: sigma-70 family RNA polymerase sigma factor [Kofleriaceae bacterium]|nr:sigma-70 family RNA polymerase sigma factor [Kofleriaceae bacterium]
MLTDTPLGQLDEPCRAPDLAALYQAWVQPVHRWIRALGGPGVDAEDLTQEVFIVVQRKLDQFGGGNIAAWLYRIVQLTVRSHRQRAWFRDIFSRPRDVELDDVASVAERPDEQLAREQRGKRLYELVHQLNPRWRDSFLLFEVGGLTGEEIATLQGISHATVRTHLFRARKAIIAMVAELQTRGEL